MNINKIGSNDNPNNTTSDMPNNLKSSLKFREVIGDVLTEEGNIIWGHGTQNKEICNSICETGLRIGNANATDSQVTFSLCNDFNTGSNERQKKFLNMLMDWPYRKSKYIIIVSFPKDLRCLTPYHEWEPFSFVGKVNGTPGKYFKPEFIKGYFYINQMKFVQNEKYYKNLSKDEQNELLKKVKKKLMDDVVSTGTSLEEYLNICSTYYDKPPYDEEDIKEYGDYTLPSQSSNFLGFNHDNPQHDSDTSNTDIPDNSSDDGVGGDGGVWGDAWL